MAMRAGSVGAAPSSSFCQPVYSPRPDAKFIGGNVSFKNSNSFSFFYVNSFVVSKAISGARLSVSSAALSSSNNFILLYGLSTVLSCGESSTNYSTWCLNITSLHPGVSGSLRIYFFWCVFKPILSAEEIWLKGMSEVDLEVMHGTQYIWLQQSLAVVLLILSGSGLYSGITT